MEISCNAFGHMQVKELRYSIKKCSICKKRCLFRTRKMVKCIVCKCTVHKRCLVAENSRARENVQPTVEDVIPNVATEPKLDGAEILQHLECAPKTDEIHEHDIQPFIAFPALSTGAVIKGQQPPTIPIRSAVASGHLPLLRLHLMDTVTRMFSPTPVQIQMPQDIFMDAVSRLRLIQLATVVVPSIKPPPSALRTITAFETKDKAIGNIRRDGVQLVIAFPALSTTLVIKGQQTPTKPIKSTVASGHLPLLQLRLMETVSRVFGPAPIQIQLPRDTFMAAIRHLRLVQMATVTPSIKPSSLKLETVTAFDCLKLIWDSLSLEQKELQSKNQRLKIAPAPLLIKSKLTILDYSKLSEPWYSKRKIKNNDYKRKVYSITYTNSQFQPFENINK